MGAGGFERPSNGGAKRRSASRRGVQRAQPPDVVRANTSVQGWKGSALMVGAGSYERPSNGSAKCPNASWQSLGFTAP
ncbi:hypothetical protein RvY_16401 [Ramazzottius varieornatus]|uniref:Uncharacterized protein n=1 Tax=Ramazzottius varieornatus TaxID=947166 RepID=A0A1D1VYB0_RAMVA|nr:hypothetical protein RvY_16401 [Ramazzottius varieornatus]